MVSLETPIEMGKIAGWAILSRTNMFPSLRRKPSRQIYVHKYGRPSPHYRRGKKR
jgi:hypothetical protein